MRKTLLAVCLLTSSFLVQAAELELRKDHPTTYKVVQGDTLWGISDRFLTKPWLWKKIWHANSSIKDPNKIYPGDVLTLTYVSGKPQLSVQRGTSRGTVVLSPTIRREPAVEAIPTIPLQSIKAFLVKNRIISKESIFSSAPYIVGGADGSVVSGAGSKVYAKGKLDTGHGYGIFRQGKTYRDPKTNELLGINADEIASTEVLATQGKVSTLRLITTTQEVRNGDRLFSTEERSIDAYFQPEPPSTIVNAEIIDVPRGVTQIGSTDVIVLNKGSKDGLKEGNVLSIYKLGETVRDDIGGSSVKLPDEEAGILMVFRTYDKLSYAIVLTATRPLSVGDKVKNPS